MNEGNNIFLGKPLNLALKSSNSPSNCNCEETVWTVNWNCNDTETALAEELRCRKTNVLANFGKIS